MTVYYCGPIDALKTMPINMIEGSHVIKLNFEATEGIAATRELQDPLPDGVSALTLQEARELAQTPAYAYSPTDEE